MRYAKIIYDDIANAKGFSVSLYVQGCSQHCPGCFNPETWDFKGGKKFTMKETEDILKGLTAHNVPHSLCILGGEPLHLQNRTEVLGLIQIVKTKLPETKIYLWTGYVYEELISLEDKVINEILSQIDYLIDGPFVESLKDLTLEMRGSTNQRIFDFSKDL